MSSVACRCSRIRDRVCISTSSVDTPRVGWFRVVVLLKFTRAIEVMRSRGPSTLFFLGMMPTRWLTSSYDHIRVPFSCCLSSFPSQSRPTSNRLAAEVSVNWDGGRAIRSFHTQPIRVVTVSSRSGSRAPSTPSCGLMYRSGGTNPFRTPRTSDYLGKAATTSVSNVSSQARLIRSRTWGSINASARSWYQARSASVQEDHVDAGLV